MFNLFKCIFREFNVHICISISWFLDTYNYPKSIYKSVCYKKFTCRYRRYLPPRSSKLSGRVTFLFMAPKRKNSK